MQRLAFYSRQRLHELTRVLELEYERGDGYLVLLRSARDLALAKPGLTLLTELNMRFHLVDAAQCRQIEPALNPDTPLHAGIHLPDDEVGNCRQFAHLLRTEAQRRGARFHFHTTVQRIVPGAQPELVHAYGPPAESTQMIPGPPTPPDPEAQTEAMPFEPVTESFDAIVVCAALGAPALLRPARPEAAAAGRARLLDHGATSAPQDAP